MLYLVKSIPTYTGFWGIGRSYLFILKDSFILVFMFYLLKKKKHTCFLGVWRKSYLFILFKIYFSIQALFGKKHTYLPGFWGKGRSYLFILRDLF